MYSMEKDVKQIFAKVTFGAAGAPTVSPKDSKGLQSITRISAGLYDVIMGTPASSQAATADPYYKLLVANHMFTNATAPASPSMYVVSQNLPLGKIRIQFNAAGTAADPAAGEICNLRFVFGDSNTI
jgi:hypothetical protein